MKNDAQRVADRVRALNDSFRQTVRGGWVITAGVQALGTERVATLLTAVRQFNAFDADNDPHGEHDFGAFDQDGLRFFWKIDYYNLALTAGSDDPANPLVTARVLTLMLADEY